jgi:hypothetical protein
MDNQQKAQTYPLLSELPGALVLSVPQKFNDTALIRSETDDLTGDVANESGAAGGLALGAADAGLGGVEGGGFLKQIRPVSSGASEYRRLEE